VTAATRTVAPADAAVEVRRTGDTVTVQVSAVIRPFGAALSRLPGTPVAAHATAVVEPGE
jgi:hypothetical protein